ncbi:hypothetical protein [Micromonospora sp. CNB394]|uniref:hypothetical protein n=1 Tax=Micromonospora sp. CNB394 TaxID=1169151 RepID=UPI000477B154|nr:hypothetical protein [Micromonospora sp. CNB394]
MVVAALAGAVAGCRPGDTPVTAVPSTPPPATVPVPTAPPPPPAPVPSGPATRRTSSVPTSSAPGGSGSGQVTKPSTRPVTSENTSQGRLYTVPGLSQFETNHAYRYLAIVTGTEPGVNGHPGLSDEQQDALHAQLGSIVATVSTDHGGSGLLPGDGTISYFEMYTAMALGSTLYRPFFAAEAHIDDAYGRNWSENLRKLVAAAGGISADIVTMMLDRAANGQPIARGHNGAVEIFGGLGKEYQPHRLRNDKAFSRSAGRLQGVIDTLR